MTRQGRSCLQQFDTPSLPDIHALIGDRRLALFGHVRRLPEGAPAHDALQVSVELLAAAPHQSLTEGENQED